MPALPFRRLETSREALGSPECLRVIPAMLQYSLDATNHAPPVESCTHEDEACVCGEVPPPACALLLSALFFVLALEIVVPGDSNDDPPRKIVAGTDIYVLSIKEIFGMMKLNARFFDVLRVKLHHFKVNSLSSDDTDTLERFFIKYSFCFDVLRTTTEDENILECLLDKKGLLDTENEHEDDVAGCIGFDSATSTRSPRSFMNTKAQTQRLDTRSKATMSKGLPPRISAAGDKKEIFELFLTISDFLEQAVSYRRGRGFQRPIFLTQSEQVCEMLLKHHAFELEVYLSSHLYNGSPILHHAVLQRNTPIVSLLLKYGADVNVRSFEMGFTPLHAVMNEVSPIVDRGSFMHTSSHFASSIEATSATIEGRSEVNCTPYVDDSLLLDLGSDVRMTTSMLHAPNAEVDIRIGSGVASVEEDTPSENCMHIVPPQIVIAHITKNVENVNFSKTLNTDSDDDGNEHTDAVSRDEKAEAALSLSKVLLLAGADIGALDAFGFTPLSMVQNTHPHLFQELQQAAASSLSPIHLALIAHLPDEQLLFIIDRYAREAAHPSQPSKLPLHLALEFERSNNVIAALLRHNPSSSLAPIARQRKKKISKLIDHKRTATDEIVTEYQLPFFYAVEKRLSDSILEILLAHTLPINVSVNATDIYGYYYERKDPVVDQNSTHHNFAWTWVLSRNKRTLCPESSSSGLHITVKTQISLVTYITEKYIRLIDSLVYSRNEEGKYAIAVATPSCRCVSLQEGQLRLSGSECADAKYVSLIS
jgi:hypothetical protein